jgi:gluconolactonase
MQQVPLALSFLLAALRLGLGDLAAAEPIPGVGPVGEVQRVSTGHEFLEGPAWDGNGRLYFTDIPAANILCLTPDGQVETAVEESRHSNGLMFNRGGELLACEMDGQLVAWDLKKNRRRVLARQYDGARFNAPNDLVIDSTGGVYFTDPRYRAPQPLPQGQEAVYYLPAEGQPVRRVAGDLPAPNGVLLSLDEKTLYVLPSASPTMLAYEVLSPGQVGPGREFCRVEGDGRGGSDGAAMDTAGNLYLTTALGIQVFSPKGELLGKITLPEHPANCTFGGPDNKTLYITARTSLYAVETEAVGHRFGGQ